MDWGQVYTRRAGGKRLLIRLDVGWDSLMRLLRVIRPFPRVGLGGVAMAGSVVMRGISSLPMLRFIMLTERYVTNT
jgi:hypothetical protein